MEYHSDDIVLTRYGLLIVIRNSWLFKDIYLCKNIYNEDVFISEVDIINKVEEEIINLEEEI